MSYDQGDCSAGQRHVANDCFKLSELLLLIRHTIRAGVQAATQLRWMDSLPELFFSEAASLSKAAIAAAVSFAVTGEQIQQVIRAGLRLEVPASQRFFLKSVVRPSVAIKIKCAAP